MHDTHVFPHDTNIREDCIVRAIAFVTDVPFDDVWESFWTHGRDIGATLEDLGVEYVYERADKNTRLEGAGSHFGKRYDSEQRAYIKTRAWHTRRKNTNATIATYIREEAGADRWLFITHDRAIGIKGDKTSEPAQRFRLVARYLLISIHDKSL